MRGDLGGLSKAGLAGRWLVPQVRQRAFDFLVALLAAAAVRLIVERVSGGRSSIAFRRSTTYRLGQ